MRLALPSAALLLALAGCATTPTPTSVTPTPAPLVASVAADGAASVPFRSLMDGGAFGEQLQRGTDERAVLRSRADLDALLARHPRVEPGPPALRTPLAELDWGAWQAIAFIEGDVEGLGTSRITGVIDRGGSLEVRTARWVAPPERGAPPPGGRIHVVAIPRDDRPITFAPTALVDGRAGAFWRAVPNPLVTRERVEAAFRMQVGNGKTSSFKVERITVAQLLASYGFDRIERYTPDSEVWVGVAEGDLPTFAATAFLGPGAVIGASEPRSSKLVAVYSVEDEEPSATMMSNQPYQADPGFRFDFGSASMALHVGDPLTFTTTGVAPAGQVTISLALPGAAPVVREVAYKDLAAFAPRLDKALLPGLADAPVQKLAVEVRYDEGGGLGREIKLLRDPDARDTPPVASQGSDAEADYRMQPGETAPDALVRRMATEDWGGTGLATTVRDMTYVDLPRRDPYPFEPAATTPVKVYEVRGTFPKTLVPANYAGADVEAVIVPTRLVVAVTTQIPVSVLRFDAYAD